MTRFSKSVGSLETWEPEDRSFSKHVISEGTGDQTPNDGAVCSVNISLVDDVDIKDEDLGSYKLKETVEVTIGEGDTYLSELLDKVLCSMKEKETCYVRTRIGIDGKKIDEVLNKKAQLKFNVILQSVNRAADISELEGDEKLEKAQHHKDKGTELFKANRLDFAKKRYKKAMDIVENIGKRDRLPGYLRTQCAVLTSHCYLNLAACYLKEENYEETILLCDKAVDLDSTCVKGHYRKGQALFKLGQTKEAEAEFRKVIAVEPNNKAAQKELNAVQKSIAKEKAMYKKMFD